MIGKTSYNTSNSFQKGFQTLNQNLTRSNATLTQRLNAQQIEIDLLQEQVNAMDTSTTEFMVASKVSLGLDKVDNTSDENKELSKKARDALDLKHPLIQDSIIDGKDQRLPQSHVQGLVSALEGKQPLITTSAKISMDKISDPYFANIQTSSADSTTLASALVNIPSTSIVTSAVDATPKVTLDTTLTTFHPKIENLENKRLNQNCVEGLVKALEGKQPLITTSAKISMDKISDPYFANIKTSSADSTTLATALVNIPSTSVITKAAAGTTAAVTLDKNLGQSTVSKSSSSAFNAATNSYTIGSIISVNLSAANITTSNTTIEILLSSLPSGTWVGNIQIELLKGGNYQWSTTVPVRARVVYSINSNAAEDFYPNIDSQHTSYITNTATVSYHINLSILFRCLDNRATDQLHVYITAPNSLSTGMQSGINYNTRRTTLTLTKISL